MLLTLMIKISNHSNYHKLIKTGEIENLGEIFFESFTQNRMECFSFTQKNCTSTGDFSPNKSRA